MTSLDISNIEEHDWAEVGRRLGYDIAFFSVKTDFTDEFIEEGKRECLVRKGGSIFDRKLVRLRIGAYRRKIPFCEEITAIELEFLTVQVPLCPLTMEPYDKFGTLGGEDNWSFDRVV